MTTRASGRAVDELRKVVFERDFTEMADGSVLVEFGRTRVLCTASVEERIPPRTPVVIAHGIKDDVVSIEGSRALAQTGTAGYVELVEVDDGHRLATLLEGDKLASMVRRVRAMAL